MFTATTTKKDFRQGVFQVTVDFTDGTETITEAFNVTSEDDLNRKIESKLSTLNGLKTLATDLVLGEWEKPTEIIKEQTPLELTTQKLHELKNKINLGVLKETDQEFIDAVTSYKQISSVK